MPGKAFTESKLKVDTNVRGADPEAMLMPKNHESILTAPYLSCTHLHVIHLQKALALSSKHITSLTHPCHHRHHGSHAAPPLSAPWMKTIAP